MLRPMSDDPAASSVLDRVNTLSAPAVAGLGAAAGLLFAVLSALTVEPGPAPKPGPLPAASAASESSGEPAAAEEDNHRSTQAEVRAGAKDGANGGPGSAKPGSEATPPPNPGGEADDEAGSGADDGLGPGEDENGDEDEDVVLVEPDVGSAEDAAPAVAPSEDAPDGAADDPPPGAAPPASPAGRTQSDRDAEAKMDADELLAAADEAYKDKRYKDAYRLSTRSQRARPRDKAQMLRGRSACRLRDEKNAREIVRSFKLGDEKRKTLRTFCKDRGVRVGL